MTTKIKINSISDFNSDLDKGYEDLNKKSEGWYPIMYYDENIVLEDKNYITIGINPSLTDNAKLAINDIFDIKPFNVEFDGKGDERFNKFNSKKIRKKEELIKYQHKLKYDSNYQIKYFNELNQFFQSVGKNFEEDVFHYDFCQLRNTASGDIKDWIKKNDNYYNLLCTHFDLIIKLINPDYIFIFNATLIEILMEKGFFKKRKNKIKDKKHFEYYNEFMDDNGVCKRKKTKFIVGNQLSGGATSRVYRANLIANVRRLLNS
jgi:hypothetical protein